MNDDGCSCASGSSETTTGGTKRRRRTPRSRTSYQIAHPAPTLTRQQKLLHIRPKLLLQLQRLSQDRRPVPSIDVLPSTVVVPRLMKKFPRMFKGKSELGANDVIIVKSEDYDTPSDNDNGDVADDESLANREVLAVICQLRNLPGNSEICLSDGSVWYGTPMPKGSFEFVTTDPVTGEKTTARWVQRFSPRRRASQPTTPISGSDSPCDQKYQFSILQSNSRRHPILASITHKVLEIPDNYTTVPASTGPHPPTSPTSTLHASTSHLQPSIDDDNSLERTTVDLEPNVKTLIQVTGIWLALRLGWCPYFRYDNISGTASTRPSSLSLSGTRVCSNLHPNETSKGTVPDTRASTPESNNSSFSAVGGKFKRSSTQIFRSSPSSTPPASYSPSANRPRRAVSTGTAFMQRAAARRAGQPPSTVASDSEGELVLASPEGATSVDVPVSLAELSSPRMSSGAPSDTTETRTKPFHHRMRSAFINPNTANKSHMNSVTDQTDGHRSSSSSRNTKHSNGPPQPGEKKGGRWNGIIKFLRWGDNSGR
jgi:hypothetical protein